MPSHMTTLLSQGWCRDTSCQGSQYFETDMPDYTDPAVAIPNLEQVSNVFVDFFISFSRSL